MTITLNGTSGINTPGVVNTAAETVATTLSVTGVTTLTGGFTVGATAAPAFSYYQSSAQTLSTTTFTKLTFTTSEFDTASGMYSSSRFTPTVAGYYQVNSAVAVASTATQVILSVFKNGSEFKRSPNNTGAQNSGGIGCLVYLNGSTDYIEMYGYLGVGQALIASASGTYFQAAMIRSA
jgi:hypothetical protein